MAFPREPARLGLVAPLSPAGLPRWAPRHGDHRAGAQPLGRGCWWPRATDGFFAIAGSDSVFFPPFVDAISDTLRVGAARVVQPVVGNLAVGRFRGPPGSYLVAYALQNGIVRVTSPLGKDPIVTDLHWNVGGANFRPYILGVDLDRSADGNLEVIVMDRGQGLVHALDLNGQELPGWPVSVVARLDGAGAAGDLDGDGYPGFRRRRSGRAPWNRKRVAGRVAGVACGRYGAGALAEPAPPWSPDLDGDGARVLVAPAERLAVGG